MYDDLINKHKNFGILIDSNILLTWIIGIIDVRYIQKFKRTREYTEIDFNIIDKLLNYFSIWYTIPNIITEINNLANSLDKERKKKFYDVYTKLIFNVFEHHIPSQEAIKKYPVEFIKFGITDCIIYNLCKRNILILTADFPIAQYLEKQNLDVINYNHIRGEQYLKFD